MEDGLNHHGCMIHQILSQIMKMRKVKRKTQYLKVRKAQYLKGTPQRDEEPPVQGDNDGGPERDPEPGQVPRLAEAPGSADTTSSSTSSARREKDAAVWLVSQELQSTQWTFTGGCGAHRAEFVTLLYYQSLVGEKSEKIKRRKKQKKKGSSKKKSGRKKVERKVKSKRKKVRQKEEVEEVSFPYR